MSLPGQHTRLATRQLQLSMVCHSTFKRSGKLYPIIRKRNIKHFNLRIYLRGLSAYTVGKVFSNVGYGKVGLFDAGLYPILENDHKTTLPRMKRLRVKVGYNHLCELFSHLWLPLYHFNCMNIGAITLLVCNKLSTFSFFIEIQ